MLQTDNVVAGAALGIADLNIDPVPMATVAPGWLVQYRKQGRFGTHRAA
jgi:NADH dehydrogenase